MSKVNKRFPHIELQFTAEGIAASPRFPREKNPTTLSKLGDRGGHGSALKTSASVIVSDWQEQLEERKQEQKPELPQAVPLILQIDPNAFDAEELRKFGIEVIAELEDGYIIGASADLQLTDLLKKIEQFINSERGGGKVPEIWEILDGAKRPEYILSPELQEQWGVIQDSQIYVVDIGISCVGTKSQLRDYPKRESYRSDENYIEGIRRWMDDRTMTYQEWDDLKRKREVDFENFVAGYQVESPEYIDAGSSVYCELPDSFSCRISISGKGLRDLVLNFPYIFDVSLPDDIHEDSSPISQVSNSEIEFTLEPPEVNAPKVCIIDSGIQEQHPLLRAAIAINDSKSWVPNETNLVADYVANGGHGTRVAGAVLYPDTVPQSGQQQAVCWLQNARVLDKNRHLPTSLYPPILIADIVSFYQTKTKTRIFNHSIAAATPSSNQYMSAWAAEIDNLTWQHDILFVVVAGNLPMVQRVSNSRLSITDYLMNGKTHPHYLLNNSCRVPNPAQSFQALTVGSISSKTFKDLSRTSIAPKDYPSSFSCTGLGIWDSIKPEVVEYGGDYVTDSGTPPSLSTPPEVCPELVRSTFPNSGPIVARDCVGTSYAAPKVTHIAAWLAAELPNESCLLYRALIVQSARLPEWVEAEIFDPCSAIRMLGYGIPNLDRALGGSDQRITLIARGDRRISARQAHIYQVSLPDKLRSPGEDIDIRVEITLSYKAQPRRTRRARRKYLSTWLDWECSKKGEASERFLERVLQEYDAPENSEQGESIFNWFLAKQKNWGKARGVSRSAGTIQKDWAIVKSYDLRESFCIAVVGHEGWNNDPNADAPYALVVSFETVDTNVQIYSEIANIPVPIQVETEVSISK
jgi:hypothetical protein